MDYDYNKARLIDYERFVFSNILGTFSFAELFESLHLVAAVCDSLAVRANTKYARSIETDIDILFPTLGSASSPLPSIADRLKPAKVTRLARDGAEFGRLHFSVPYEQDFGHEFLIDLHIGGYFYKNQLLIRSYSDFFEDVEWAEVPSIGRLESVRLPIPAIAELFIFKMIKGIGQDNVDLLTLLLSERFVPHEVCKKVLEREPIRRVFQHNLDKLLADVDRISLRWTAYYLSPLPEKDKNKQVALLTTLREEVNG